MNLLKFAIFIIPVMLLQSCANDSESDLIDKTPIANVTYNGAVKTIITENCIECHTQPPQNGAPMPLLTYDNVKNAIETRGLIDRISSTDPNFSMPYGRPRLTQEKINTIIAWRDANYPE
jgi:hypothetical protein